MNPPQVYMGGGFRMGNTCIPEVTLFVKTKTDLNFGSFHESPIVSISVLPGLVMLNNLQKNIIRLLQWKST